jgi:hypothetical protein
MLRGDTECAYCGKVPATTIDHVVPKCLFEPPLPLNMITVPACSSCNGDKSQLDSFLRDFLVSDSLAPWNRVADAVRVGAYQRAVSRNQSELWKAIAAGAFEKRVVGNNGIDPTMLLKVPFGRGSVKEAITYIVRGLHFRLKNKRLPEDHVFLVGGLGDSESCIRALRYLQSFGPIGIAAIGPPGGFEVFSSFMATWYTKEDHAFAASVWGLAFYDRMHIACITIVKSKLSGLNPRYLKEF